MQAYRPSPIHIKRQAVEFYLKKKRKESYRCCPHKSQVHRKISFQPNCGGIFHWHIYNMLSLAHQQTWSGLAWKQLCRGHNLDMMLQWWQHSSSHLQRRLVLSLFYLNVVSSLSWPCFPWDLHTDKLDRRIWPDCYNWVTQTAATFRNLGKTPCVCISIPDLALLRRDKGWRRRRRWRRSDVRSRWRESLMV